MVPLRLRVSFTPQRERPNRSGKVAVATTLVLLIAAIPIALANHAQTVSSGGTLVFDHKTGNEWWLELVLTGTRSAQVAKAEAMDTGGPWTPLTKRSWGAYAASFHIEPGNKVLFRATLTDGAVVTSCAFTHPAGVESCATTTPTPTTHPDCVDSQGRIVACPFDATFTNVKGNEWWVEAKVTANQPISGVDARVNCGTVWKPLTLRSWGAWAASFNIPANSKVDLRARSSSGAQDLSGGYIWPAATATSACGTAPAPLTAEFFNVRGNSWWIETEVSASQPVAKVQYRVDNGPWHNLTKQSWGSWAKGPTTPLGFGFLEFRATSTSGAMDTSYQQWMWPDVVKFPTQDVDGTRVAWDEPWGSPGRIEVNTASENRIKQHFYSVNGGSDIPMTLDADGDWVAKNVVVKDNDVVSFHAIDERGSTQSEYRTWPFFPQPGSYAVYEFYIQLGNRGSYEGTLEMTMHAGGWSGTCDYTETRVADDGTVTSTHYTETIDSPVPQGPPIAFVDETVELRTYGTCNQNMFLTTVEDTQQRETAVMDENGDPVVAWVYHAHNPNLPAQSDYYWSIHHGLLTEWTWDEGANNFRGYFLLVDTNAHIQ